MMNSVVPTSRVVAPLKLELIFMVELAASIGAEKFA
jgi:hypothetical protein